MILKQISNQPIFFPKNLKYWYWIQMLKLNLCKIRLYLEKVFSLILLIIKREKGHQLLINKIIFELQKDQLIIYDKLKDREGLLSSKLRCNNLKIYMNILLLF